MITLVQTHEAVQDLLSAYKGQRGTLLAYTQTQVLVGCYKSFWKVCVQYYAQDA